MTLEEVTKAAVGTLVAALGAVTGWLARVVVGNRAALIESQAKVATLEAKVASLESRQLTREDLRAAIEDALNRRDDQARERRGEWDRRLALEIRQAVTESVVECQRLTRAEIEQMVPRIVREVLGQQKR